VLLGSALAAGVVSLSAHASQSSQDTGVFAGLVTDETFAGSGLGAVNDSNKSVIDLSGTGVTWSLNNPPSGVSISGTMNGATTISYSGSGPGGPDITADATDSNGNADALEFSTVLGNGTIQMQSSGNGEQVSVSNLTASDNSDHTVTFSAYLGGGTFTYAESNLPAGLTSGSPTLTYSGGTAAQGNYSGVKVTATNSDGAVLSGTFTLTVGANTVYSNNYGNYVNKFGNGFDVFREQKHAGALIVGWSATYDDPATHFLLNNGTHPGAYQIEYEPNDVATGLCVSDPGGGWPADPLRDGLILAKCNTGPFQQFILQSNGSLKNVGTGLYVNPDGTGAQLRGESSRTSSGGSYTWKAYTSLPM